MRLAQTIDHYQTRARGTGETWREPKFGFEVSKTSNHRPSRSSRLSRSAILPDRDKR